jgi:hypothetical protein
MVLLRIVLAGALGIAALTAVKRERLLERAHVVGSCRAVAQAPDAPDGSVEWRACSSGRLSGRPSLRLNGCTSAGLRGAAELWRCPARLASSDTRP